MHRYPPIRIAWEPYLFARKFMNSGILIPEQVIIRMKYLQPEVVMETVCYQGKKMMYGIFLLCKRVEIWGLR